MTIASDTSLRIRPITLADNPHIARVIRHVSAEFGLTADKGYTVSDPNSDHLFELYSETNSAYWIIELDGKVAGGGGIAPLQCSAPDICELQRCIFCRSCAAGAWHGSWRSRRSISPANAA